MTVSRRTLLRAGAAAAAAPWSAAALAEMLARAGAKAQIGATDWNLRQTSKLEALELGKRIGFAGVQVSLGREPLPLPDPKLEATQGRLRLSDPELQRRYREEAAKQGVQITSTCLDILHRNYLKNDPLGRKWLADSIPITKALGTRVILLPFFGRGALMNRQEMDHVADILRELGPEAEKQGIILGLENTISAEDNVRIMDRAKSPAVKVYYDVGNSTNNGFDIYKEIRWLGRDRICEIHLKDNPHFMGQGRIHFPGVVDALAEIGFSRWAVLETDCPTGNVEADMKRNLEYIRGLMASRGLLAGGRTGRESASFWD